MTHYCGIDAARYVNKGHKGTSVTTEDEHGDADDLTTSFRASMAAAVCVESYEDFSSSFGDILRKHLQDHTDNVPPALSTYEINKITGNPSESERIQEAILQDVTDMIEECRIIFSYFRTEDIYCYGESESSPTKKVAASDFIQRYLDNYYPHIAAWRMLQEGEHRLMLDHFQGHVTDAWRELEDEGDVAIYAKGDSCNPLISASDLLLEHLNRELHAGNKPLLMETAEEVMQDIGLTINTDWLGDGALGNIVPRKRVNIPASKYLAKPTFYLIRPQNDAIDRKMLLYSPYGKKLMRKVTQLSGCVKFLNKTQDRNFMEPGDYVIYFDEDGEEAAELLEAAGYDLNMLHISDVDEIETA